MQPEFYERSIKVLGVDSWTPNGYHVYMKDGLYHRDIFLPMELGYATMLRYSPHARAEASSDRYGNLTLPMSISTRDAEVIEVEVVNGKPVKALFRTRHDERRDICLVVLLDTSVVKTVWCNVRTDSHKTLDASKYMAA